MTSWFLADSTFY